MGIYLHARVYRFQEFILDATQRVTRRARCAAIPVPYYGGMRKAMKKYNEIEQAKLTHYIRPARKGGRALWAAVRLRDKKIVGWYSSRSQALVEWKRFNAAFGRITQSVTAPAQTPRGRHLHARHPLPTRKAQPDPKPAAIDRVVVPGMLLCHKCKRLCSNKGDLFTHTCLGKKMVKPLPMAKPRRLKLRMGGPIRRKKLTGAALRESKRKEKKRRKREAMRGKSPYLRRLPGSGWAGRGQR